MKSNFSQVEVNLTEIKLQPKSVKSNTYYRHLRASPLVSGFDMDLRVNGLLKTVTFVGAEMRT